MMGSVYSGIYPELALSIARTFHLTHFLETGTYMGRTSSWAATKFAKVTTIELNKEFATKCRMELGVRGNVTVLMGNSPQLLLPVLTKNPEPALIWLDAHWSRDLGYEKPDVVCPVLDEIDSILESPAANRHAILIDDARLFGIMNGWPNPRKIKEKLQKDRVVFILDDIIVAIPKNV